MCKTKCKTVSETSNVRKHFQFFSRICTHMQGNRSQGSPKSGDQIRIYPDWPTACATTRSSSTNRNLIRLFVIFILEFDFESTLDSIYRFVRDYIDAVLKRPRRLFALHRMKPVLQPRFNLVSTGQFVIILSTASILPNGSSNSPGLSTLLLFLENSQLGSL